MRIWVIGVILLVLFTLPAYAEVYQIYIETDKFNPANVTINSGDTLRFVSIAGTRQVIFDDGTKLAQLSPGTSTDRTLTETGTYPFELIGEPNIKGKVEVVESGALPPVEVLAQQGIDAGIVTYVAVDEYQFTPRDIDVVIGTTVVWENIGVAGHSVDFDDGQKKSINVGQSYNRTFNNPGIYNYRDRFYNVMRGSVTAHLPDDFEALQNQVENGGSSAPATKTHSVSIEASKFNPPILSVNQGDKVTWTNNAESTQTVVGAGIQSPELESGETFTHTFSQSGVFDYSSSMNPQMVGSIEVAAVQTSTQTQPSQQQAQSGQEIQIPDDLGTKSVPGIQGGISAPEVDSKINEKLSTFKSEMQTELAQVKGLAQQAANAVPPDVAQFENTLTDVATRVDGVQTQLQTMTADVDDLKLKTANIERLARNPPVVEQPSSSPGIVYIALLINFLIVFVLIGVGVYFLKKPHAQPGSLPHAFPPKKPTGSAGVSSVVKGKKEETTTPESGKSALEPVHLQTKKEPKLMMKNVMYEPLAEGPTVIDKKKVESYMGQRLPEQKMKDPIKQYIARCKERGLNQEAIVQQFIKSGWSEAKARALFSKK